MSYLIDTSVLTRLRQVDVRRRVEELDDHGLARASITDLELGFSASSAHGWDALMSAVSVFERVEVEPHHFERARQVQRLLAERGLKGRKVPDLLVAAAAEATSRTVLHYDADFDRIASVTGQPTEWVAARGTVD